MIKLDKNGRQKWHVPMNNLKFFGFGPMGEVLAETNAENLLCISNQGEFQWGMKSPISYYDNSISSTKESIFICNEVSLRHIYVYSIEEYDWAGKLKYYREFYKPKNERLYYRNVYISDKTPTYFNVLSNDGAFRFDVKNKILEKKASIPSRYFSEWPSSVMRSGEVLFTSNFGSFIKVDTNFSVTHSSKSYLWDPGHRSNSYDAYPILSSDSDNSTIRAYTYGSNYIGEYDFVDIQHCGAYEAQKNPSVSVSPRFDTVKLFDGQSALSNMNINLSKEAIVLNRDASLKLKITPSCGPCNLKLKIVIDSLNTNECYIEYKIKLESGTGPVRSYMTLPSGEFLNDTIFNGSEIVLKIRNSSIITRSANTLELHTADSCISRVNLSPACTFLYGFIDEPNELRTKAFPNPSHSSIRISNLTQDSDIRIVDIHGKLIKSFSYANEEDIDISELSPGVYFVLIKEGERSQSLKFIKQ